MKMSKEMMIKRYNGALERRNSAVYCAAIRLGLVKNKLNESKQNNDSCMMEHFTKLYAEVKEDYEYKVKDRDEFIKEHKEYITIA